MLATAEQIAQVAENPAKLGALVKSLSDDKAVELMIKVIEKVDTLPIGPEAKKNRVAVLFSRLIDEKGAVRGNEIIARIVKKVNPRLLPVIRFGGNNSPATIPPPMAPTYARQ